MTTPHPAASAANGPLQGIKVLDLGAILSAPMTSGVLADQGADVIKVEPTGIGDLMRYVGATVNGVSALFQSVNRGKRSIALNLKSAQGVEVLHRLAADADVLIHNFRPGVTEKLGADYATLHALNPQLIYLSISGFGHTGPMAGKAAYDPVVQAFAGVAYSQVDPKTGEPTQYQQLFADKLTGIYACQAVTAALVARERGAGGQHIQLAMADTIASFMWPDVSGTASFKDDGADPGLQVSKGFPLIKFRDGYAQAAPLSDANFHGLCAAFGVDSSDPRLATLADRSANPEVITEVTASVYENALTMNVDETLAKLDDIDVPNAQALPLHALPAHPQMQANGLFVETQHPKAGTMIEPRNPANFSETPSGCGFPHLELGANTDEILGELGFSAEQVVALRDGAAVG